METYIALLRGINVGGKNLIKMAELKVGFEDLGFDSVKTYINSGNVLFKSSIRSIDDIQRNIETMIIELFGLNIPIVVYSKGQLEAVTSHAPSWWNQEDNTLNYAIFVLPNLTVSDVFEAIGAPNVEYELVANHEKVIYWTAGRDNYAKTKWYKISSSSVNSGVTIRNSNTVNKLVLLANEL